MTLKEALVELEDGALIRRTCWPKGCYLGRRSAADESETGTSKFSDMIADDWEIFDDSIAITLPRGVVKRFGEGTVEIDDVVKVGAACNDALDNEIPF
jgi:hypothetical protein